MEAAGELSLVLCNAVRQVRGAVHAALPAQMALVPGKRVVVQKVPARHLLRGIAVDQVKHEQYVVHLPLVKDREVVEPLLIRKEVPDGAKDLRAPADLQDDEKHGVAALRKEKGRLLCSVNPRKLGQEGTDKPVLLPGRCLLDLPSRLHPIDKIVSGERHQELVEVPRLVLRLQILRKVLLPGRMLFQELLHGGKRLFLPKLRVSLPQHVQSPEGGDRRRLFVDGRIR